MFNQGVTAETLRECLHYDPETGIFTWLVRTSTCIRAGAAAGWIDQRGYHRINLFKTRYGAHRLAWLYVHGVWPAEQIDHRNGDRLDNRIANLRECSNLENGQNQAVRCTNTSGFMGVNWKKSNNAWIARIRFKGKQIHLGSFKSAEQAYSVYLAAKASLHQFQPVPRSGAIVRAAASLGSNGLGESS